MQSDTRILIISNRRNDPQELRSVLFGNESTPDIQVARSHAGALKMARIFQPQLCILRNDMVMLQGRSFAEVLKQACPGTDVFIVEDDDLTRPRAIGALIEQ
jgi:DNA-binding NarL/FixJ family response regulator